MEDHSVYRTRAAKLGPNVEALVMTILKQGQGFVDTRKIWGILSLDKRYDAGRIDAACQRARAMGSLSYRMVHDLLEMERIAAAATGVTAQTWAAEREVKHRFVRPLSVYGEQLSLSAKEGHA